MEALGRYGKQFRYSLGGNTVVINAKGKVITMFGKAKDISKKIVDGKFIPFD